MSPRRLLVASIAWCTVACNTDEPRREPGPSPNAAIPPAPLAPAPELVSKSSDGGAPVGIPVDSAGRLVVREPPPPPPKPVVVSEPLPRDTLTDKDGAGLTLEARWKWADVPQPEHAAGIDLEAIGEARSKTVLTVTIDLATVGRMRLLLGSPSFPLPAYTELRARTDRYGHILVWPDGSAYRLLAPGALRAVFTERRPDVTPLVRGDLGRHGGAVLLGQRTERIEVSTKVGKLVLEQAKVDNSGAGGPLLCRLLVELAGVEPSTAACRPDLVPLAARYEWASGGGLALEATSLARRQDLPIGAIFAPPAGAAFKQDDFPPQASGVFLTREDLQRFRSREQRTTRPPEPGAPGEGITAVNRTDSLRYVLLDGVAIAWVRPHEERYVIGPRAGRYTLSWRDFLGAHVEPPKVVELPAVVTLGAAADAGAQVP